MLYVIIKIFFWPNLITVHKFAMPYIVLHVDMHIQPIKHLLISIHFTAVGIFFFTDNRWTVVTTFSEFQLLWTKLMERMSEVRFHKISHTIWLTDFVKY